MAVLTKYLIGHAQEWVPIPIPFRPGGLKQSLPFVHFYSASFGALVMLMLMLC